MSLMTQNQLENSERAGRVKSTSVLATIAKDKSRTSTARTRITPTKFTFT